MEGQSTGFSIYNHRMEGQSRAEGSVSITTGWRAEGSVSITTGWRAEQGRGFSIYNHRMEGRAGQRVQYL